MELDESTVRSFITILSQLTNRIDMLRREVLDIKKMHRDALFNDAKEKNRTIEEVYAIIGAYLESVNYNKKEQDTHLKWERRERELEREIFKAEFERVKAELDEFVRKNAKPPHQNPAEEILKKLESRFNMNNSKEKQEENGEDDVVGL